MARASDAMTEEALAALVRLAAQRVQERHGPERWLCPVPGCSLPLALKRWVVYRHLVFAHGRDDLVPVRILPVAAGPAGGAVADVNVEALGDCLD